MQQQQQQQQDKRRRSSLSKLLARCLDSFVASHSGRDDHGDYNNDDNCSVVSGCGSLEARRRAARHQQMMGSGHQSPQQPQPPHGGDRGIGHVYRSGSDFHKNVGGSMSPLHQSSTSISVPPGAKISDFIVVDWERRGIRAQSHEDENARFAVVVLVVDHHARGIARK
jgi:hypothetical protein